MTSVLAPQGSYVWGQPSPAEEAADLFKPIPVPPSAFNRGRGALKPRNGSRITISPGLFKAQTGPRKPLARRWVRAADYRPARSMQPQEFDKTIAEDFPEKRAPAAQRADADSSAYARTQPRTKASALKYAEMLATTGATDDQGNEAAAFRASDEKTPLPEIKATAEQLAASVDDSKTQDLLDEIRAGAEALLAVQSRRALSLAETNTWKTLSDELETVVSALARGAAVAVSAPAPRIRTKDTDAALRDLEAATKKTGADTVAAITRAVTRSQTMQSGSPSSPYSISPQFLSDALTNFSAFIARQQGLTPGSRGYADKAVLTPVYYVVKGATVSTGRVSRAEMLREIETFAQGGKGPLEKVSIALNIDFQKTPLRNIT